MALDRKLKYGRMDIIREVVKRTGYTHTEVKLVYDNMMKSFRLAIDNKYNIHMRGFAHIFLRQKTRDKYGLHPTTPTPYKLQAHSPKL